jgi:hypothetical protein
MTHLHPTRRNSRRVQTGSPLDRLIAEKFQNLRSEKRIVARHLFKTLHIETVSRHAYLPDRQTPTIRAER